MIIRTPKQSEHARAKNFVDSIDGCSIDASIPDCNDPERFQRTLVAESRNQVSGVGAISCNWLHPARLTLDVFVAPDDRREGIGTALLDQLVAAIPSGDARSLKAAGWSDDEASVAFWRNHRFTPIMRTDIGTLDDTQASSIATIEVIPDGIAIVSGEQIPLSDSLWDDIAHLHERIYRANHEWSPPRSIDLSLARRIFLDPDDLIPDVQLVAMRNGAPFAVASLRALTSDGACELGWAGGNPGSGEEGFRAARMLVARCLTLARERGWTVDFEADRSDPVLRGVVEEWSLTDHRIWVNYSRGEP